MPSNVACWGFTWTPTRSGIAGAYRRPSRESPRPPPVPPGDPLTSLPVPPVAQVEPLTTTRRVSGPFDYALPEAPVEVGSVVRIPFGRQRMLGVVTGLADGSQVAEERLVAPTEVLPESLPPDLVDLALWIAEEYCSTPARALSLVLPPPGRPRTALWAHAAAAAAPDERLTERQRA